MINSLSEGAMRVNAVQELARPCLFDSATMKKPDLIKEMANLPYFIKMLVENRSFLRRLDIFPAYIGFLAGSKNVPRVTDIAKAIIGAKYNEGLRMKIVALMSEQGPDALHLSFDGEFAQEEDLVYLQILLAASQRGDVQATKFWTTAAIMGLPLPEKRAARYLNFLVTAYAEKHRQIALESDGVDYKDEIQKLNKIIEKLEPVR
jgi:hypothetical protein